MSVPAAPPALDVTLWDGDPARWDVFVAGAEGATFCHLAAWRQVIETVFGHECLYAVAVGPDGGWRGVLPLVRVRSRIFGHSLVSMPFLNAGGPLGDPEARARLAAWAAEEARRPGADLLAPRARTPGPGGLRVSHRKITVVLELPGTAEELWERTFRAKLRSQVRRAERAGFEPRFGAGEAEAFYAVFARNMRDLGTPVLPWRFFDEVRARLGGAVVFGAVYRRGEPVAGGCGVAYRDTFELTWASSLRRYAPEAPSMLLYWSFLAHAVARGAGAFDFGRCTPGSGTHRFKLQWGGRDRPLPWAQWSRRGLAGPPTPDRPAWRLAARVWRRIPLAVASRLGPVLARSLP